MRGSRFIGLIMLTGLLSGCGYSDWLSADPDGLRVGALVRQEVERTEVERGKIRRDYIDRRIDKKMGTPGQSVKHFSTLEQKIAALGTRLDVVSRRAGTPELGLSVDIPEGPSPEDFEQLRGEARSAIRAVADLIENADQRDATANARFERLEYRTRTVEWPVQAPGTGPGLHLASYKTHESALQGWEVLLRKYPTVLAGREPSLTELETVAGRFVRLVVGGGLPETSLIRIRNHVRAGGDYAMIVPIPLRDGRPVRSTGKKPEPGS